MLKSWAARWTWFFAGSIAGGGVVLLGVVAFWQGRVVQLAAIFAYVELVAPLVLAAAVLEFSSRWFAALWRRS